MGPGKMHWSELANWWRVGLVMISPKGCDYWDSWCLEKKIVIMFIFRTGRKEDLNYRLLNIASVPEKKMEQIYLEATCISVIVKVTGNNQHGFTEGKSCFCSLIAFYSEITSSVGLHFNKAFNIGRHNITRAKFPKCGLNRHTKKCILKLARLLNSRIDIEARDG